MNKTIENLIKNIEIDEAIDLSIKYLNVYFTKEELIDVFPLIKNRYKEYFNIIRRDKFLYDIKEKTSNETFRKLMICIERAKILLNEKK